MRNVLIYFAIKYQGNYLDVYNAIRKKERVDQELFEKAKQQHTDAITCIDDDYPLAFKVAFHPPLVLFYKGNKTLFNSENFLGFLGSQEPSDYGVQSSKKILSEVFTKKSCTLVTTLDKGLNSKMVELALKMHQKVIVILPSGIDNYYPSSNYPLFTRVLDEGGLIISEYPRASEVTSESFTFRLRFISALATNILIGESDNKGQVNALINFALEGNNNIFTIPSSIMDLSYNNALLKEGANPAYDGECITERLL